MNKKRTNQALFSTPVLAALMILITLLVWVLNATAPAPRFPTPSIETWQTNSGIPVTWLNQDSWKSTNTIEIRLLLNHGRADDVRQGLTDATFDLLLLDTLSLSTSSINQRLEPLGAKVDYRVNEDDSELALTLNGNSQYLNPSMDLLSTWLNGPTFKPRTFARWQQNDNSYYLSPEGQLYQYLYPVLDVSTLGNVMEEYSLSLQDIEQHYQQLINRVSKVVVVGNIANKIDFQQQLDAFTKSFKIAENKHIVTPATQIALHTQDGKTLLNSYGAVAINHINNIDDWISLQIWLSYLFSQLNQAPETGYVQMHIQKSHLRQWAWWGVQYPQTLTDTNKQNSSESMPTIKQDTYATKKYLAESLTKITKSEFEAILKSLKETIATQTESPSWWARIASQETSEQQPLTLETWLKNYATTLNEIDFNQYQKSIEKMVLQDSYQEIQMRK